MVSHKGHGRWAAGSGIVELDVCAQKLKLKLGKGGADAGGWTLSLSDGGSGGVLFGGGVGGSWASAVLQAPAQSVARWSAAAAIG